MTSQRFLVKLPIRIMIRSCWALPFDTSMGSADDARPYGEAKRTLATINKITCVCMDPNWPKHIYV